MKRESVNKKIRKDKTFKREKRSKISARKWRDS
jgi:hypothetical protein